MNAATIEMQTSRGRIHIEVDEERAPKTAESYVRSGFFDGPIFHRIIPGFVIQGGGFQPDMFRKRTEQPVAEEHNESKKALIIK